MATIVENLKTWTDHDWKRGGDEWSEVWGGPENQWWGTWYPRLRHFLGAGVILEIAPGYGRWTRFAIAECERFVGVDLTERCTQGCRERFAAFPHAEFFTNDGRSLPMLADGSVDFAFSLDSLVHADLEVLDAYLAELRRVLRPSGAAFLHHSNLGGLAPESVAGLPITATHWRAPSVSAAAFRRLAARHGLSCIAQETVNWGSELLLDCLSVVTHPGSPFDRPLACRENPGFMDEALRVCATGALYGGQATASTEPEVGMAGRGSSGAGSSTLADQVPLPPPEFMALVCGREISGFAETGRSEVQRLEALGMLRPGTRFLDLGCGCGRMARFLLDAPLSRYEGFDRHPGMIDWCVAQISRRRAEFHFRHADLRSVYEKLDGIGGKMDPREFRFPYSDEAFDSGLAASLFTHMPLDETAAYLKELWRTLARGGRALVSVFLARERSSSEGLGFYHAEAEWLRLLAEADWRHSQVNERRYEPVAPDYLAHHNWFLLEK